MTRIEENQARLELTNAISAWWNETELLTSENFPFVGENFCEIMASAALQVLLGVADTQEYLRREEMFVED